VEAMAGGTPVITSDASVMPEIAGDAALYINPYQPAMLVAQTIALLEDKTLRQSLVEKGKQRALQFTWGSSVQALLQTYELMMQDE
jgi:glycosyltransferase involved in cell wall biosynthesis